MMIKKVFISLMLCFMLFNMVVADIEITGSEKERYLKFLNEKRKTDVKRPKNIKDLEDYRKKYTVINPYGVH